MTDPVTAIHTTTQTVNALSLFIDEVQSFVPKLVMFCSFLSAIFPPPDPASKFYPVLSFLDRVISSIALNVGHVNTRANK